ncbi:ISH7-type transposase NmgIRS28 [Natrialba magadii ATCC 43099]|uniref:ISH7-type transposase NmgIRS28 n=1 Tax=Natrialba magadii (strain ATCC 43099 / DSM 3394 / CCM 3739 / CIP 104546 / IAM 13178 / JCM 8861 / NBRC 102185 / NCIMB 2190 / MS3) TaxID=547559 RepID=D3SU28_NATMM|nr:transposase [Natrialba magadii]ADD07117.1 ISH7-type transposase NmgIRS28 [Natrialba magadii ATCC 43099]ELY28741.1 transposase IS4 family protein [Natrialba magadii ATCC 43099]
MTATPNTKQTVLDSLRESHREWPYSEAYDTVNGDPWPLAWDAAAFIEEWFAHPEHNDVEEAICYVELSPSKFGYDVADWHFKQPPASLLKAHLLRIVKGWGGETALHDYLDDNPELVAELGFEDGLASKTTLWRVWNEDRLSDEHKQVVRTIGQVLVDVAREHDVPAPDEVFHPDTSVDTPDGIEQDDSTVRDRTIAKTREIWQQAKPIVTENYELPRGKNTEVHDNAFLEAHAFIGSREEMYAENGTWNFAAETTRNRVQTGSTHRHHLQKIGPDAARKMHRDTTRELIERARRDSELVDGVLVSIDITKSNPYRTKRKIESDEDGNVTNTWLLGYKNDGEDESTEFYFQWASIQIVGLDIPLVLDAIPVHRGLSRVAIVDQLLETATDMVDIELVMMDREFAHDPVKEVCEDHGVWYLNPGKMHSSERATCTRLRRQEKLVHIESDEASTADGDEGTTLDDFTAEETTDDDEGGRKRVYVPAMNAERTNDTIEDDEDSVDDEAGEESGEEDVLRQELLRDFAEATDADTEDVGQMFGDVIDEVREEEEEQELPGSKEDKELYMLFETNHPDLELPGDTGEDGDEMSELEKAHMAARVIRKYKHRWGIENGFKQIKSFRVRTTSMDHEYRFFNFLYACTMYNVWRLTDLLVKLELRAESEFRYEPLVTADLFLTIAKDYVGLDPPD